MSVEQVLSQQANIYHTSRNYILASIDEKTLLTMPKSSYNILESFPVESQWYLVTKLPGKAIQIQNDSIEEITQMDNTIIIKSELSYQQLSHQAKVPFVKLDFTPLRFSNTTLKDTNQPTRVDFGNLLNHINADSIQWFMQQLQNFGTRNAQANNRYDVADWIRGQFTRLGITNAVVEPFFVQNSWDQYNVVATIPGTLAPNKYIVVGGHHDSIVLDGNDPIITAPGADDNASGTAAVLEYARVLKANNYQPECSIRFVTFACEEYGLFGSKYHAQVAFDQGQDIKLMINHDMISNSTLAPGEWFVELNPYSGFEGYSVTAANLVETQTTLIPSYWMLNSAGSDSYSFWQRGFPSVYFSEGQFSPFYHSINDLVANTNTQYAKEVIKASLATCITFDQTPSPVAYVNLNDTGTGNSIQVSWGNLLQESDVVSYKVYVTDNPEVMPIEYSTTNNPYILNNLTNGVSYWVGVAPVDSDGNIGLARYVTGMPHTIPQTPAYFDDLPSLHAVTLNWSANSELDIAGYKLYRSTSLDGNYTPMTLNLITTTSYTDDTIQDLIYYYYKLVAVDNDYNESPPTEAIRTRGLTLNHGILIVDETRNNTGNTVFAPNDTVSDAFFNEVLHDFAPQQFDTETDGNLKIADIGIYSSIFWHGNDFGSMTYPYSVREELRKYIQAGGNVFISSYFPTQAFDNNNNYPTTFGTGNYLFDNLGIWKADYNNQARFRYALPQDSGFPALTVDSLKTLTPLSGHIYSIESIEANANAQNIYYYGSDYTSPATQAVLNGLPIGVYYNNGISKSVVISFPLYNMKQNEVTSLMYHVFHNLFGETVANIDENQTPQDHILINKAYPNPFSTSLNLEISGLKANTPTQVSIYNIKGQKIKTLMNSPVKDDKQSLSWDGKDEQGTSVAGSIYIVKAEQAGKAISRKIIKLK
jgi:hypothetical protein